MQRHRQRFGHGERCLVDTRVRLHQQRWGGVQRDGRVGAHAIRRLRAVVDETLAIATTSLDTAGAGSKELSALSTLRELAAPDGPLDTGTLTPRQFTAALAALDHLEAVASPDASPMKGHHP